ncbi:hypothetical protein BDR06DRAFT_955419 [Suillus hirtellus]|nr:hypothetical protein BDR06DRAFT_955419 [Suillus hirtellus]
MLYFGHFSRINWMVRCSVLQVTVSVIILRAPSSSNFWATVRAFYCSIWDFFHPGGIAAQDSERTRCGINMSTGHSWQRLQ